MVWFWGPTSILAVQLDPLGFKELHSYLYNHMVRNQALSSAASFGRGGFVDGAAGGGSPAPGAGQVLPKGSM